MTLFLLFRNRRAREAAILQAIENGVETLFDIVANVYSEVPRSFWIPAASNVRLHVDHLADQNKLPKVRLAIVLKIFSMLYGNAYTHACFWNFIPNIWHFFVMLIILSLILVAFSFFLIKSYWKKVQTN